MKGGLKSGAKAIEKKRCMNACVGVLNGHIRTWKSRAVAKMSNRGYIVFLMTYMCVSDAHH